MDKLKAIKIKQASGSYGDSIPIGVDAENVDLTNGKDLETSIAFLDDDTTTGSVDGATALTTDDLVDNISTAASNKALTANQGYVLNNLITSEVSTRTSEVSNLQSQISTQSANLTSEASTRSTADASLRSAIDALVSPSGQSVVVDSSLSISGAAADAKVTGDDISQLKDDIADLSDATIDVLKSSNRYNFEDITTGGYIPYNTKTGKVDTSVGDAYSYSHKIDVHDCEKVTISRIYGDSIGSLHCVFYDSDEAIIPSVGILATDSNSTLTIPSGAYYMVFSFGTNNKKVYKVEKGESATDFCYFLQYEVPKTQKYIEFDYPNDDHMAEWLATIKEMASDSHWFNFNIPSGTYNILNFYSSTVKSADTFKGMFVPDFVILNGHSKEDTTISCSYDSANSNVSPLNFAGACGIKNLHVLGNKTRYAIHDDFAESAWTSYADTYERIVENCKIECIDPTMGQAYGSGTHSGAIWNFKDTEFINGFSWHSNSDFDIPNNITFENCIFDSKTYQGVVLKGMGSGVINQIHFVGCSVPMITCTEGTSGDGMDFVIDGNGNNDIPVDFSAVTGTRTIPLFREHITELKAGEAITKGTPIYRSAIFAYKFGTRHYSRLCGVALSDASENEYLKVLTNGYYLAEEVGLESLGNGAILTVSNGSIVEGTTNLIGCIEKMWTTPFLKLF